MKQTKITIGDVAAAAGVSKTTVSRYINGQYHLMSEKTQARIKTVIELLNYHPSDIARSLKSKRTNMIGVVISDISSPFSSAVIMGISDMLYENNYTPLFVNCNDDPNQEETYIRSLIAKEVDGLIVNTTSSDNKFLISIAAQGLPVVLCDREIKDYNFDIVQTKNQQMMLTIVSHLQQQGFTRPSLFTQNWTKNSARYLRRDGFLQAVQQVYGYDAQEDVYLIQASKPDSTVEQLKRFMADIKPGEIPAIFGVNSVTTMRVYRAILQLGLEMPNEIGLCGPDDWNWGRGMNWPEIVGTNITTMGIQARQIGEWSARLLLNRLENPDVASQRKELSTQIAVRTSTQRI